MKLATILVAAMLIATPGLVFAAEAGGMRILHGTSAAAAATQPGVTSLDVYAEQDRIHVLIANRLGDGPRQLEYVHSDDAGVSWSTPQRVGEGQPPPDIAHRGMDVQIAAAGEHLMAAWTTKGEENRFGRGPIATAVSADGGKTWRAGPNPADDGSAGDHAFLDITADEAGTFHMAWLDSRAGAKALIYARSTDGGATWSPNVIVKRDTCECCWNTITTAPGGKVFILFRDKNPRDMAMVESPDGGRSWAKPSCVGAFDWDFDGCPHVGGGLAANAFGGLDAVVWTAKSGSTGTYFLTSANGGESWSAPTRLANGDSSHPDVARSGGRVAAVWDAFADGHTSVFAATSDGTTWSKSQRVSDAGASATHPRIVAMAGGFVVLWTEQSAGMPATWVARRFTGE